MSGRIRPEAVPRMLQDLAEGGAEDARAVVGVPSLRQRRRRAIVAALLAVLAVVALGVSAARAQRRSSIQSVAAATQVRMDQVVHDVQQMPGLERIATARQLIDAHGSWPGGLDAPGIVAVDRDAKPDWADAQWLKGMTLRPAIRLTEEERARIRRPGAVVQGTQIDGNRLTAWVMVEPRSTTDERHPWLFCGAPQTISGSFLPAHLFRWIVAAMLVALAAGRSAHRAVVPHLRDVFRDLRWRISGLVVGTTVITCALLSVLTLDQAHNERENTRDAQVQEAVQGVLGLANQESRTDPLTDPGVLQEAVGGNAMEIAVASVRNGVVDPLRLQQVSGSSATFFQRLPSDCLDFSVQWKEAMASGTPPTSEGGLSRCGGDRQLGYQISFPAGKAEQSAWVVLVVPDQDQDGQQDLWPALAMGSFVAVVIAMAAASRLARKVQRPVVAVRQTAELIATGHLEARAADRADGELGRLGAAVNTMADRLTTQISQLEQVNEHQRRFVSDVAHELRTPAAALLASATALENPATRDEAALRVAPQVRRLAGLTQDLLEISRLDAGQAAPTPVDFDLSDLVREVTHGAAQAAGRPGDVRLLTPGELPVCLDPVRVQVSVRNLVDNALRHGRPPVTVLVRRVPWDGAPGAGDRVVVEVGDEGAGVPPELRERIFDRFVQADPSRHGHGSGLGLAIARANARLLGGDLVLDADNRTFRLTLPTA